MELVAENEYECLPDTTSTSTHMMAGALAGIGEHCIMYPIDCIKTRMQSIHPNHAQYNGIFHALKTIHQTEGLLRTVRGINAVLFGAGPSHALYFACYEKMKKTLSGSSHGHNPLANVLSGGIATLLHDAAMNPVDVVKQRLQMYKSPYSGAVHCVRSVLRAEGLRAFYRSYTTQLAMNIPFQVIHFEAYELGQHLMNPRREYNPLTHMVSGGLAGATAAAITTPLDVCKTLLNTQEMMAAGLHPEGATSQPVTPLTLGALKSTPREGGGGGGYTRGMVNAVKTVYACCGPLGFLRGLQARVLFQMPATAISWSVYEFFKYTLGMGGSDGGSEGAGPDRTKSRGSTMGHLQERTSVTLNRGGDAGAGLVCYH